MTQFDFKNAIYKGSPLAVKRLIQAMKLRGTRDCVFLWIPKTAGTSMFSWLQQHIGMRKLKFPSHYLAFPDFGAVTFGHIHYPSLVKSGIVSRSFNQRAFKFAIVRNPYSRIVSIYNYLVDQGHYHNDFEYFIEDVRLRRPAVGLYGSSGLSFANPQSDWLIDETGEVVANRLLRLESLDVDFPSLASKLGVDSPTPLKKENISKTTLKMNDLDQYGLDIFEQIEEIYYRDFVLFNYEYLR